MSISSDVSTHINFVVPLHSVQTCNMDEKIVVSHQIHSYQQRKLYRDPIIPIFMGAPDITHACFLQPDDAQFIHWLNSSSPTNQSFLSRQFGLFLGEGYTFSFACLINMVVLDVSKENFAEDTSLSIDDDSLQVSIDIFLLLILQPLFNKNMFPTDV